MKATSSPGPFVVANESTHRDKSKGIYIYSPDISLCLSGTVDFRGVFGHDDPGFDPRQEYILIFQLW